LTGVVTTFAGLAELSGNNDGPGPDARFSKRGTVNVFEGAGTTTLITGLSVIVADSTNNIYVADNRNGIRKEICSMRIHQMRGQSASPPFVKSILPASSQPFLRPATHLISQEMQPIVFISLTR
jgi:hypothetical protein